MVSDLSVSIWNRIVIHIHVLKTFNLSYYFVKFIFRKVLIHFLQYNLKSSDQYKVLTFNFSI